MGCVHGSCQYGLLLYGICLSSYQILGWINTSEWLQVREKIMRFGSKNGWESCINDDLNEKVIHKWIIFYCHVWLPEGNSFSVDRRSWLSSGMWSGTTSLHGFMGDYGPMCTKCRSHNLTIGASFLCETTVTWFDIFLFPSPRWDDDTF